MSESLEARLAQAVERARVGVLEWHRTICREAAQGIVVVGPIEDALERYGDLRAAQGRWEEHHQLWTGGHVNPRVAALEAEIEALIGGGP